MLKTELMRALTDLRRQAFNEMEKAKLTDRKCGLREATKCYTLLSSFMLTVEREIK